jgi:hypothetical protein
MKLKTSELRQETKRDAELDASKIYEFYFQELLPALLASFPILIHRLSLDFYANLESFTSNAKVFLAPNWTSQQHEWVASNLSQLWEKTVESSTQQQASVAEFLLKNFDVNNDGHISASELVNMTEIISRLQPASDNKGYQTFFAWISREWPLFDWKLGVFLWRSFGGILFALAVLSIIPGRLHKISGQILRWPILLMTYVLIVVELIVYIMIRLFIRLAETIVANSKHRLLRQQMASAETYVDWYEHAAALDLSQKRDKWQKDCNDSTGYRYNWGLIRQLMTDMRLARYRHDSLLALAVLRQCTRKNVGGIMSEDLFSYTNTGEPKLIVSQFIEEVAKTLHWITDEALSIPESNPKLEADARIKYERSLDRKVKSEKDKIWKSLVSWATLTFPKEYEGAPFAELVISSNSRDDSLGSCDSRTTTPGVPRVLPMFHRLQLIEFLKSARAAYGRTALCLSGGAAMGCYHFGHLKGLMETDCLPHIISGTSAGSAIGALVCTRTNEELKRDLDPEVISTKMAYFKRSWPERVKSVVKNGHMFGNEEWLRMVRW